MDPQHCVCQLFKSKCHRLPAESSMAAGLSAPLCWKMREPWPSDEAMIGLNLLRNQSVWSQNLKRAEKNLWWGVKSTFLVIVSLRTDEYDTYSKKSGLAGSVSDKSNYRWCFLPVFSVLNVRLLDHLKELGLGNLSIFYHYRWYYISS